MEVHLTDDMQAKLNQLTAETGRSTDDFIQDAMAGYFDELAQLRTMLDQRCDDVQSGRVKLVPGEEVVARLHEKSAARRLQQT